jgi:predicted regulator of Ras-like GTPase activity (Roadblock/LC7/MglB family)
MIVKETQISGSQAISQLLEQLTQEEGFIVSVLTDSQGLSLAATASDGMDSDVQSAAVAQVQKAAAQVGKQLGMAQASEIILNDANGQQLICRPFYVSGQDLVLAVTVQKKGQTYRRAMNRTIAEIQRIWQRYWE